MFIDIIIYAFMQRLLLRDAGHVTRRLLVRGL